MQKISLFHLLILDTVNFRVPRPDWPHPFSAMPTKIFDQLLIFVSLYQHEKNKKIKMSLFQQIILEKRLIYKPAI